MSKPANTNWSVERGLVDTAQARIAAVQAKVLQRLNPDYVEVFEPDDRSWEAGRLSVLHVAFKGMSPAERADFAQLLAVSDAAHRRAAAITGKYWFDAEQEIFLNFYEPGASTRLHRDAHTRATVAVGLVGEGKVSIGDPRDRTVFLDPADALILDNTVPVEDRPVHEVECLGDLPRIALVNATR